MDVVNENQLASVAEVPHMGSHPFRHPDSGQNGRTKEQNLSENLTAMARLGGTKLGTMKKRENWPKTTTPRK